MGRGCERSLQAPPGPVNPLRLRGGERPPSSLRAPTISPTSPRHRGPTATSLVEGERLLFPTQSLRQVEHCSHPLRTSHPDPGGDSDLGLLLLPPPKTAFLLFFFFSFITASNTSLSRPPTSSTPNLQTFASAPCCTRSPWTSTKSHRHPPPAPPVPGTGVPAPSPPRQHSPFPNVTHTHTHTPTSHPAKRRSPDKPAP